MESISSLHLLAEAVRSAGADIAPTYQEYTTVQRNYPIGSVDLNRNHSSDVLV